MNVNVNELFALIGPLSNAPAVSDVTVCAALSVFIHVTVVPTLTCIELG